MKTLADALLIRRRIFGAFEMARTATDPDERRSWLSFALVGAGPTGVEAGGSDPGAGNPHAAPAVSRPRPRDGPVLLFDAGAQPLAAFGPELAPARQPR